MSAPADRRVRVLLVDDEPLIRSGLRAVLECEDDIEVVGGADDGAAVVALVARLRPDVVLMDIRMPGIDGIQATRLLVRDDRPQNPGPKVVVVTTFENDDHVWDALHAGAAGFLLKRSRPEELVQAVRIVAAGDTLLFPAAVRRLAGTRSRAPASGRARDSRHDPHRLTEREQEVLRLLARGDSNAEIAGALVVSHETVKTHVGSILAKLGARDRTQAVVIAYETGFVPVDALGD